jgi:hypothetical protein
MTLSPVTSLPTATIAIEITEEKLAQFFTQVYRGSR